MSLSSFRVRSGTGTVVLSPRGFLGRRSGQRFAPCLPPPALVRKASRGRQIVSISLDLGSGPSEDPPSIGPRKLVSPPREIRGRKSSMHTKRIATSWTHVLHVRWTCTWRADETSVQRSTWCIPPGEILAIPHLPCDQKVDSRCVSVCLRECERASERKHEAHEVPTCASLTCT